MAVPGQQDVRMSTSTLSAPAKARRREARMDDIEPDWSPDDGLIDPYFDDDGEGWLPDWLPSHRRDPSHDEWIL